jgi:hypothetical protein
MSRLLWRTGETISILYHDGRHTDAHHASDFTMDMSSHSVVLSMDFSRNERTKNKSANRYLDVQALLEHFSEAKQVQITRHKNLAPFLQACAAHPEAPMFLELRFDNSVTHRLLCSLRTDERNLWFDLGSQS